MPGRPQPALVPHVGLAPGPRPTARAGRAPADGPAAAPGRRWRRRHRRRPRPAQRHAHRVRLRRDAAGPGGGGRPGVTAHLGRGDRAPARPGPAAAGGPGGSDRGGVPGRHTRCGPRCRGAPDGQRAGGGRARGRRGRRAGRPLRPQHLVRVFTNLLTNADKYGRPPVRGRRLAAWALACTSTSPTTGTASPPTSPGGCSPCTRAVGTTSRDPSRVPGSASHRARAAARQRRHDPAPAGLAGCRVPDRPPRGGRARRDAAGSAAPLGDPALLLATRSGACTRVRASSTRRRARWLWVVSATSQPLSRPWVARSSSTSGCW